jgi:hypothetical protein
VKNLKGANPFPVTSLACVEEEILEGEANAMEGMRRKRI